MKNRIKQRTSANDLYNVYTVPEKLIQYKDGFHLTEGIYDIADNENCFSVLDMICRHKRNFEVEIWEFKRHTQNLFILTGKDQSGYKFVEIPKLESDFYFDDLTLLKKGKLLCLPIEENMY